MVEATGFFWQQHAAAEQLFVDALDDLTRKNRTLANFRRRLAEQASCRLIDWVDYLQLPDTPALQERLETLGFLRQPFGGHAAYYHPGALLPAMLLAPNAMNVHSAVALRVDSAADFLQANHFDAVIEGSPSSPLRRARCHCEGGVELCVVERRGNLGFDPATRPAHWLQNYLAAVELWQTRPRLGVDEDRLWLETFRRAEQLVARLGVDLAAHVVCLGERRYWQTRNAAGQMQKSRQDALGLGWGNHDHHTFRSSRRHFARLVKLFTRLGFVARERFYAGDQAGWGAQVMENRAAGLSLFLDVDLAPEEVETDFSREELPERETLGTVGLWCALHGDSIFAAGMHHIAARCDFHRLSADLARLGIPFMAPFSDFPWLKQAFSVVERWPVDADRLETLVIKKLLSREQADKFLAEGAIGSHLENIQRDEGYKGFNKNNVSAIIRKTDPRI
ncbi:hypothetical protein Pcar_2440 [Syntrophotalea carbinolica DSM 2380]|uniref:Uncharacterized protein n=1 Tax=Syntrophotalea carbinolica (strain DSM 2380 / NBRC 103641 / GraBd1) TaxID=338963 RepID=Q3A1S8_SYNC1|nr:hypothetical protein [Syntrophotalea carbinolica]ABA89679.1 hypothetical protein Pcar_2440 [Syntrophotalea carbinolica DSM 2380]